MVLAVYSSDPLRFLGISNPETITHNKQDVWPGDNLPATLLGGSRMPSPLATKADLKRMKTQLILGIAGMMALLVGLTLSTAKLLM